MLLAVALMRMLMSLSLSMESSSFLRRPSELLDAMQKFPFKDNTFFAVPLDYSL